MQTTIEVAYVNQPKPGKKMGSVKTIDGQYYGVWPDKLYQYQPGGTYTVEYDQSGDFKNIKRIISGNTPGTNGAAPAARSVPNRTSSTAEEMFVMGVIGRCMQGVGTLPDAATLTLWIKALRHAWKNGFAANTDQQSPIPQSDLNDEIPF